MSEEAAKWDEGSVEEQGQAPEAPEDPGGRWEGPVPPEYPVLQAGQQAPPLWVFRQGVAQILGQVSALQGQVEMIADGARGSRGEVALKNAALSLAETYRMLVTALGLHAPGR